MHDFIPDNTGYRVVLFDYDNDDGELVNILYTDDPDYMALRIVRVVGWISTKHKADEFNEFTKKWVPVKFDTRWGGVDIIWDNSWQGIWQRPWLFLGPNDALPDQEMLRAEIRRRNKEYDYEVHKIVKLIRDNGELSWAEIHAAFGRQDTSNLINTAVRDNLIIENEDGNYVVVEVSDD